LRTNTPSSLHFTRHCPMTLICMSSKLTSDYILAIIQSLHLPLASLAVRLSINCRCCWACMSSLVLDEPEVVLNVIKSGQVSVPKHVRMQLADTGFLAELLHFFVDAAIYHTLAFCAGQ